MKRKLNCILLVEDDKATNYLHNRVIKEAGCTENIAIVDTGQEALDFLSNLIAQKQPAPGLILLDINMPVMNAWEFLEVYCKQTSEIKSKTKIVMLTTSLNPDDEVRARDIPEISGFYYKPLDKEMLQEILEKHFADWV